LQSNSLHALKCACSITQEGRRGEEGRGRERRRGEERRGEERRGERVPTNLGISCMIGLAFVITTEPLLLTPEFILMR
jgi:hypothetical protein